MDKPIVYRYRGNLGLLILALITLVVALMLIFVAGKSVFLLLGLPPRLVSAIMVLSFIGSFVNIPIYKIRMGRAIYVEFEYIDFMGVRYRVPYEWTLYGDDVMIVALNVGGALIPVLISIYLLWRVALLKPPALPWVLVSVAITAIVVHFAARPIRGLGIAVPSLLPPLVASTAALMNAGSGPECVLVTAYVAGTLGSLIGADLMNIPKLRRLEARMVSIGGAGTFDGIFLSGIFAVILVLMLY